MTKNIKRFCFYGGPSSGKTTLASKVFYDLKICGFNVVLINEWIKPWAIQGRFPKSHEQLFVFANQQHLEDEVVDYVQGIISDSPLLMNAAYSTKYGFVGAPEIIELSKKFENQYPGLHFWIHRKYNYQTEGRYQTLHESLEMDEIIKHLMIENLPSNHLFVDDLPYDEVLTIIKETMMQ